MNSRGPVSLFHAAAEREKEEAAKREHHIEMIKHGQVNIFELKQNKEAEDAMLEQVITRLKAEMEVKKANSYVQAIGEQMIEYLQANPSIAEQMTDETKTLDGSYQAVAQFARGKTAGSSMTTPQEAFEAIMGYYGVTGAMFKMPNVSLPVTTSNTEPSSPATEVVEQAVRVEQPVKKRKKFSASLEDLI